MEEIIYNGVNGVFIPADDFKELQILILSHRRMIDKFIKDLSEQE